MFVFLGWYNSGDWRSNSTNERISWSTSLKINLKFQRHMSLSFVGILPYLLNISSGKVTLIKFTLGYVLPIPSQTLYNLRLYLVI